MTRWFVALCFSAVVWWNPGFGQAELETGTEGLPALVFRYLDSPDSDEAERLLVIVRSVFTFLTTLDWASTLREPKFSSCEESGIWWSAAWVGLFDGPFRWVLLRSI